jgi:hypothetical protein
MDEDKNADIVDELNKRLHSLSASFFNFVGALQRDAPPASLDGEPIVTAPPSSAAPPFDIDVRIPYSFIYTHPSSLSFLPSFLPTPSTLSPL